MKLLAALCLASCLNTAWATGSPDFYVVDVRRSQDAILHSVKKVGTAAGAGLPYVMLDAGKQVCCFKAGPKPGERKSPLKIDADAPPLSSEKDEDSYQLIGHVTGTPAQTSGRAKLAFGVEGMTRAIPRGAKTYEVTTAEGGGTVVVRHCLATEGVNFSLYRSLKDKTPYATYYYALGYEIEPDCPDA